MGRTVDELKRRAAEAAVALVEDGMTLGLGTGSTVRFALEALGRRVRDGLRVRALASSSGTERLAGELGIPLVGFAEIDSIDLVIDGADEVSADLQMIKGGGGALLREKILAAAADRVAIIADDAKKVEVLGRFPLPVEVVPFGHELFVRRRRAEGIEAELRQRDGRPVQTDSGNLIVDCPFHQIPDPAGLHLRLVAEPGVVETGLFIDLLDDLFLGTALGVERIRRASRAG